MDYEKKYKELVKAIKQLQETNPSDEGIQNWANDVLYETEEVENERIRKALIAFIKKRDRSGCDYDYDKWIAWLEKQGQKSAEWHREDEQNLNACLGYIPDEFLRRWLKDAIYVKYDKPDDKVEKFKVKYAGYEYNVLEIKDIAGVIFYGIEDEPNHIDYVKAENCKIIGSYTIKEDRE